MNANPIVSVLFVLLVAASIGRYYVQRGELRKARQVALAAMMVAASALPPHHQPAELPPRDPDERRKPATPPFGSPVACAPDAGDGVDGGGGAMLAEPARDELAGELQASDYEHAQGFVVGAPLTR